MKSFIILYISYYFFNYMGMIFSSDEHELDTTNIEYYHNIYRNCGIAGMYVPLPYVKKKKIKDGMNLENSFSSDISITSTSSLNEIVAAKHLSRLSVGSNSVPSFSSTLSHTLSHNSNNRSSHDSNNSSVHSIETIPLN